MIDPVIHGPHNPGEHGGPCGCGDLRREIGVTEPDLIRILAAAREALPRLEADPDATPGDLLTCLETRRAIARAETRLERKGVPHVDVSKFAAVKWDRQAMYPDRSDADDVANYHPEGTRDEILARIRREAEGSAR